MNPELILAIILELFPHMSGNNRQCIENHQDRILQQVHEATDAPLIEGVPSIPPEVLMVVGFVETHLGCDAGEGGNWGAPIDAEHRHTAGTHMHAAYSLARGYQRCGSWDGAIMRFRTGLCNPRHSPNPEVTTIGLRYLRLVHHIIRRIEVRSTPAGMGC